jgi:hypothetical protein
VCCEKHPQEIFKGYNMFIVLNTHDFGVAGTSRAYLTIRGVLDVAPHVARNGTVHPFYLFEDCFNTPKTACAKGDGFQMRTVVHSIVFV